MSLLACKFRVIQFVPFGETEEFANVGVALFCPKKRQLEFRLAPTRFKRITHFFEQLEPQLYRATLEFLREELKRIQTLLENQYQETLALQIFDEATRQKGGLISFSGPKFVYAEDPGEKTQALYQHYVERSFTQSPDWEQQLVQRVRETLKGLGVDQYYRKEKLSAGLHSQSFPFVYREGDQPRRAIKPLVFYHQQPERAVERMDMLNKKITELTRQKIIADEDLLLEISLKDSLDPRAKDYIQQELKKLQDRGVRAIGVDDEQALADFATRPFHS